jgi:hypothetical protein
MLGRILGKRFPQYLSGFEQFLSQASFELVADPSHEEIALHKGLVRDEAICQ